MIQNTQMMEVTALCRAKINLSLDVLGLRPDGYHNIESVIQSIDLADVLRLRKAEGSEIEISIDRPDIPSGPGNTVYTACALFLKSAGMDSGVAVGIEKRIPHQAGLGGGSSDAAGALLAMNKLFGGSLTFSELAGLAAQIGSDVPYFLIGGTALASGRGEIVEKLPNAPPLDLVIVKPDAGVSTAWAYSQLFCCGNSDCAGSGDIPYPSFPQHKTSDMIDAISHGDRNVVVGSLSNDFDELITAEVPVIAEIKCELTELGAEKTLLCGSGSAVFGVFRDTLSSRNACRELDRKYSFAAATNTLPVAITVEDVVVSGHPCPDTDPS